MRLILEPSLAGKGGLVRKGSRPSKTDGWTEEVTPVCGSHDNGEVSACRDRGSGIGYVGLVCTKLSMIIIIIIITMIITIIITIIIVIIVIVMNNL